MEEFIDFVNEYGLYAFGLFLLIFCIFFYIYLTQKLAKIRNLYSKGEYDKCINAIKSSLPIFIGYKKDWLNEHLAMSLIGKENYSEALQILVKIKHEKLLEGKVFWQCFALVCLNRNEEAVKTFEDSGAIKDDLSYKIMRIVVYGEPGDPKAFARVTNKVIIRYIEAHYH